MSLLPTDWVIPVYLKDIVMDPVSSADRAYRNIEDMYDTIRKSVVGFSDQGDIPIGLGEGLSGTLGKGTANYVLAVSGTAESGLAWIPSPTSVLTETGDMLYASDANTLARLDLGAEGTLLRAGATIPAWTTLTMPATIAAASMFVADSANVLKALTGVAGDLIYANATPIWTKLGKGTANQILGMNAGATLPEWQSHGTNTQVLFNDGVVISGDAGLVYDHDTNTLTLGAWATTDAACNFYANSTSGVFRGRSYIVDTWAPAVQASPAWNFYDMISLTSVGLSDIAGKTATQLWNTSNHVREIAFTTAATLANSHAIGLQVVGIIPADMGDGGGGDFDVNGVPQDAQYQEIGGVSVILESASAGHLIEGSAVWLQDHTTGAAVATIMTGSLVVIDKNSATSTYFARGFSAISAGSQQTTYAPDQAFAVFGGWQFGLDLAGTGASPSVYSTADICFQKDVSSVPTVTITTTRTPPMIYFNVGGASPMSISATGVAVAGGFSITGTGTMVWPGAGIPLSTGSAWGTSITNNSAAWNAKIANVVEDTTPELGGNLSTGANYVIGFHSGSYNSLVAIGQDDSHIGAVSAWYQDDMDHGGTGIYHDGTNGHLTTSIGGLHIETATAGAVYIDGDKKVACGGGSTGAGTTPNGTVTLVINGTSYYLLTSASA